jgi:hypothetical protein
MLCRRCRKTKADGKNRHCAACKALCSKCDEPRAMPHRYCADHKLHYMRGWRLKQRIELERLRRLDVNS